MFLLAAPVFVTDTGSLSEHIFISLHLENKIQPPAWNKLYLQYIRTLHLTPVYDQTDRWASIKLAILSCISTCSRIKWMNEVKCLILWKWVGFLLSDWTSFRQFDASLSIVRPIKFFRLHDSASKYYPLRIDINLMLWFHSGNTSLVHFLPVYVRNFAFR